MSSALDEAVIVAPQAPPRKKERDEADEKQPKRQPPYAVIVHNDDFHTWQYVIEVLQRVCGHDLQNAFLLTSQVHHAGKAPVWTGPKEVAELKRDQIRGFGTDFHAPRPVKFPLGVTIEPLPEG
ncbi:MAG: ATP-dependent Clp protease adaptor ClpS [Planctomycetales bacterium]